MMFSVSCMVVLHTLLSVEHGAGDEAGWIRPEVPLVCKKGDDKVLDDKGAHCERRVCATRAVCPPGWVCTPVKESVCPEGGSACEHPTTVVRRLCQEAKQPAPSCPTGTKQDKQRTLRLLARIRKHPASQTLLNPVNQPLTVCYGAVSEGVVGDDGAIVLQRDRPETAQAARLAHLVVHVAQWLPFSAETVRLSDEPCSFVSRSAVGAEEAASEIENELRRSYKLPPLPEDDVAAAALKRCEDLRGKP